MALTLKNLEARAQQAIDNDEAFITDVALQYCQMVDNVKHMSWFLNAVCLWLTENTKKWEHLADLL